MGRLPRPHASQHPPRQHGRRGRSRSPLGPQVQGCTLAGPPPCSSPPASLLFTPNPHFAQYLFFSGFGGQSCSFLNPQRLGTSVLSPVSLTEPFVIQWAHSWTADPCIGKMRSRGLPKCLQVIFLDEQFKMHNNDSPLRLAMGYQAARTQQRLRKS